MATLKQLLAGSGILAIPGIYDALSGLLAERAGIESVFLSGSSMAYAQLGQPDIGLVTMNDMTEQCARITDRIDIPVIVDVDSGFGNSAHAGRTVRMLEKAGAAAIQIEDQIPIKPDDDLKGRPLISPSSMADKIKAALDARKNENMLISARSDSPFSEELGITLERVALYREAGTDAIFVEGLKSINAIGSVIETAGDTPVLFAIIENGASYPSVDELKSLGTAGVYFPVSGILGAATAFQDIFARLASNPGPNKSPDTMDAKQLNNILGIPELLGNFKN